MKLFESFKSFVAQLEVAATNQNSTFHTSFDGDQVGEMGERYLGACRCSSGLLVVEGKWVVKVETHCHLEGVGHALVISSNLPKGRHDRVCYLFARAMWGVDSKEEFKKRQSIVSRNFSDRQALEIILDALAHARDEIDLWL